MRESFLKKLFATIRCSICGQKYEVANIEVVGHEGEVWFLNASCGSCGTQGLIVAVVEDGKTAEISTDLTEAEYDKFADSEMVDVDDVLDMHRFLREFEGDFVSLFSEQ